MVIEAWIAEVDVDIAVEASRDVLSKADERSLSATFIDEVNDSWAVEIADVMPDWPADRLAMEDAMDPKFILFSVGVEVSSALSNEEGIASKANCWL